MPPQPPAGPPRPVDTLDVPAGSAEVLPPAPAREVLREGLIGLGCVATATGLAVVADFALAGGPTWLATVRLILVGVGSVLAGHALSRRASLPAAWAVAAAAGYLGAVVAAPAHWDSLRLLLMVGAGIATGGAVLSALPARIRYPALGLLTLVHFGGILTAVTWPEPAPWLTNQVGTRVYLPYLQFAYLRNAYHFYSPEPGPANLLFALITYELDDIDPATGKKATVSGWEVLPNRSTQTRDPLGLSYYRRLSITEYSARYAPDAGATTDERRVIDEARHAVALGNVPGQKKIPLPPPDYELPGRWYQHPQPDASRYVLPSYAKHLATEYTAPGRRVTNVRLYRAEHRIVSTQFFVKLDCDPYHPTLYRVYFLGDFTPAGKLVDSKDPMLYHLLPVTMKRPDLPYNNWTPDQFYDSLSEHAGHVFVWRSLRP